MQSNCLLSSFRYTTSRCDVTLRTHCIHGIHGIHGNSSRNCHRVICHCPVLFHFDVNVANDTRWWGYVASMHSTVLMIDTTVYRSGTGNTSNTSIAYRQQYANLHGCYCSTCTRLLRTQYSSSTASEQHLNWDVYGGMEYGVCSRASELFSTSLKIKNGSNVMRVDLVTIYWTL